MKQFTSIKKTLTVATLAALVASGCTVLDPYTGEEKTSNAVKYGAGAAVVCGLIGATKNSKYARNAALGCGAIGAGVGAYMDHQEAELREELAGTGVGVKRNGDKIQLIMPGDITFETDRHDVNADFYPVLNSVAKVLYKYVDTDLEVAGFTDSVGSDAYNQELSEKRASSVASYLRQRDIQAGRLHVKGFGERYPIAPNETAQGRAQNRRVELTIIPQEPS
ncbi:OmpA family protein [Kangiella sediminilitoris]|uniref:Membrane protein n=1 Tax=Kangiella sediminilitoris TaxID=1144748 RepID=A0A1B3BBF2_9GAMM|nr:OmpA family protein [Kangiella sediminilitoris]AOE50120.1 membrane protein [Kangiella sediminilitoris]